MSICPYCKGEMDGIELPRMSGRMLRIYTAVLESGTAGISPSDLLVRMYAEEEWPTPAGGGILRVQIHEINKRIAAIHQRITNWHRGNYRLVSTKVQQQPDRKSGHEDQTPKQRPVDEAS